MFTSLLNWSKHRKNTKIYIQDFTLFKQELFLSSF